VITSGQIGLSTDDSGTSALVEGGTVPQLRQALENVATVLRTEGATMGDVVKTTLYLVDMGEFAAVNEVFAEYFTDRPTRSAVAVAALPAGARVEVEAWAYVPEGAGPEPLDL
jgi:2-iminobutanoate/2-iminopropanoate deaminase